MCDHMTYTSSRALSRRHNFHLARPQRTFVTRNRELVPLSLGISDAWRGRRRDSSHIQLQESSLISAWRRFTNIYFDEQSHLGVHG